jgi:hypothetical protein
MLPRELAESRDATAAEVNCVANYAIISVDLNSTLNDVAPEDVFASRLARPQLNRAEIQLFDKRAVDLLKNNGYDAFRKDRAKRLAANLNRWLRLGE